MGRGIPAERSLSEISYGKSREVREAGSNAYTKRNTPPDYNAVKRDWIKVSELSGVTKSDYKLKCNMLSNGIYAVEVVSGSIKSVKYYKVPIRSSHVALREKFVDVEIVNVVSNWVIEVLEDFDLDSGRKIVYLYVDGLVASVVKVKPGDRSLVAIY
ncbi:hypothetical protein NE634_12860 [Lacrimispora saccharolytica]|nr:hypothetical protein [Lacrimispora saccharolytica]